MMKEEYDIALQKYDQVLEIYKKLGWMNHKEFNPENLPQSREDLKCELYPKNAEQVWETYLEVKPGLEFYDDEGEKIVARQQLKSVYHRNGVAYSMTRECLLNQKTIIGKNTSAILINDYIVNLDTENDLFLAELLSEKNKK